MPEKRDTFYSASRHCKNILNSCSACPKDHKLQQKIIIQLTNNVTMHVHRAGWPFLIRPKLAKQYYTADISRQFDQHYIRPQPAWSYTIRSSKPDQKWSRDDFTRFLRSGHFVLLLLSSFLKDPACKRIKAVLSQILFQTNQFLYLINQPMRMPGVLAPSGSRPGPTLFLCVTNTFVWNKWE